MRTQVCRPPLPGTLLPSPPGQTEIVSQSQPFPPYTPPLRCNPHGLRKVSSTVPLSLHPPSPWLLLSLSSPSQKPVSLAERQVLFPVFLSASPAHSSAAHTGSEPGRQRMKRGIRGEKAPARSQTSTRSSMLDSSDPLGSPPPRTVTAACHPCPQVSMSVEDMGLVSCRVLPALMVATEHSESEKWVQKGQVPWYVSLCGASTSWKTY